MTHLLEFQAEEWCASIVFRPSTESEAATRSGVGFLRAVHIQRQRLNIGPAPSAQPIKPISQNLDRSALSRTPGGHRSLAVPEPNHILNFVLRQTEVQLKNQRQEKPGAQISGEFQSFCPPLSSSGKEREG
jgi:hypothetical protein